MNAQRLVNPAPGAQFAVVNLLTQNRQSFRRGLHAERVACRALAGSVKQAIPDEESPGVDPNPTPLVEAKICLFSAHRYVLDSFQEPLLSSFPETKFVEHRLNKDTAKLAEGCEAVVIFVNDDCDAEVVDVLADLGVRMIALRCAGFDRVDLTRCEERGVKVARVPTYSPTSVAEHAVTLVIALCRNLVPAHNRVKAGNFVLSGLTGMELFNKTTAVIGTGAIGKCFAKIMLGFGCRVLAFDLYPDAELEAAGVTYVTMDEAIASADILSLHVPLLPSTRNLICSETLKKVKRGVVLVNVSRGGLVDTNALIDALLDGRVGAAGLDVYEQEEALFFQDLSKESMASRMSHWDRRFAELTSLPNVIVTPHIAFLTKEALNNIADTTCANLREFFLREPLSFEVKLRK